MAHNIANFAGHDQIVYIDDTPWHGLGPNIRKQLLAARPDQRVDLALELAGMNYSVGNEPLFLADGTPVPSHRAAVRYAVDGSVAAMLSVVGKDHTHSQNRRNVDICRVMAESHGCVPAAAGVLGNGERCWMLMRLADEKITPVPGDDVNGYFLLYWGHDGDLGVLGYLSLIRAICQNTINAAINGKKAAFSIRHTSGVDNRIDEAARLMGQLMAAMKTTGDTFASLARKGMGPEAVAKFIEAVIPAAVDKAGKVPTKFANRREAIAQLAVIGRGADMASQLVPQGQVSAWALVNAVTEYWDHVRPAEAKSEAGKANATKAAIFGEAADNKVLALNLARQLVMA
jgi:phage/plasmid-like protein (TIGR03299 family)